MNFSDAVPVTFIQMMQSFKKNNGEEEHLVIWGAMLMRCWCSKSSSHLGAMCADANLLFLGHDSGLVDTFLFTKDKLENNVTK